MHCSHRVPGSGVLVGDTMGLLTGVVSEDDEKKIINLRKVNTQGTFYVAKIRNFEHLGEVQIIVHNGFVRCPMVHTALAFSRMKDLKNMRGWTITMTVEEGGDTGVITCRTEHNVLVFRRSPLCTLITVSVMTRLEIDRYSVRLGRENPAVTPAHLIGKFPEEKLTIGRLFSAFKYGISDRTLDVWMLFADEIKLEMAGDDMFRSRAFKKLNSTVSYGDGRHELAQLMKMHPFIACDSGSESESRR